MILTPLDTPSGIISRYKQNYKKVCTPSQHLGTKIKFNIVNLTKPDSLANDGMKPCVKSTKHFQETGIGWHRDWNSITYKMNKTLRNRDRKPDKDQSSNIPLWVYYYFTMSFTYELLYDDDTVFFAHAVPYTYNYDLMPFLDSLAHNRKYMPTESTNQIPTEPVDYSGFLRIGTLCKSLAGNACKMVTITENVSTYRNCNDDVKWCFYTFYL